MDDKTMLMRKIQMIDFMLLDLSLYLDTHPKCSHGIAYYNKYKEIRKELDKAYNEKYGSFSITEQMPQDKWSWVDGPWPWEKEAN